MKRKLHGRNLRTCVTYCAVWQRFYFLEQILNRKSKRGREKLKKISDKFCPIFLLWIRFCIYSSAAYTSILYFPYLILNTYSLSCAQNSVPERSCNQPIGEWSPNPRFEHVDLNGHITEHSLSTSAIRVVRSAAKCRLQKTGPQGSACVP